MIEMIVAPTAAPTKAATWTVYKEKHNHDLNRSTQSTVKHTVPVGSSTLGVTLLLNTTDELDSIKELVEDPRKKTVIK